MAKIILYSLLGPVKVNISRDGTLSSKDTDLNEAINYDRSMMEFGEEMSDLLMFVDYFEKNILEAIIDPRLIFNMMYAVALGTDFVEHVSKIYFKQSDGDETINKSIELLRQWQAGDDVGSKIFNEPRILTGSRSNVVETKEHSRAAYWVLQAAQYVVHLANIESRESRFYHVDRFYRVAKSAQSAMALSRLPPIHKIEDEIYEMMREQRWQFRRTIDVIDAIQAGTEIPPVSETR